MKIETRLVYRNKIPHVFSIHAYFPSIVYLDNGDLLTSFSLGEAFEATNLNSYISRSTDSGKTWEEPKPILDPGQRTPQASNCVRLTALDNGVVYALLVEHDRSGLFQIGFANPDNLGFVPTKTFLIRSFDYGYTWETPVMIEPPLIGPSFELCCPIVRLKNDTLIWPTSTWRGWDGYCPNGMKMVAWVSKDGGDTWPSYMEVMNGAEKGIIFWEGKIIPLDDDMLLAAAWAYDEANGRDLPNHYAISCDGGDSWTPYASTGILGQTIEITRISDGRILSVYRRVDDPGLWATISVIRDNQWINEDSFPLWGSSCISKTNKPGGMVASFNELKFGAPNITHLPDGTILLVFWCYENLVSNIRAVALTL